MNTSRTYKTVGHAVNDPTSNLARFVRTAEAGKARNANVIDAYIAQGMTREQAWAKALKSR